jgi:phosphatidylethanolamine-binding protein (PEBP) family uncharacterized protein
MRRSPTRCRRISLLLVAAVLATVAACGTSGRALREPDRNAVAPTRSTAAPTSSTYPPTAMSLVAEGFDAGSELPKDFACGGRPPTLQWKGIPSGTAELAFALVDYDETDELKRIHWLVAGVPVTGTEGALVGGALPAGAVTLGNGQGKPGYPGPCLAPGQKHTFNYLVFSLPAPSGLSADSPPRESYEQLENAARGEVAAWTVTVTS